MTSLPINSKCRGPHSSGWTFDPAAFDAQNQRYCFEAYSRPDDPTIKFACFFIGPTTIVGGTAEQRFAVSAHWSKRLPPKPDLKFEVIDQAEFQRLQALEGLASRGDPVALTCQWWAEHRVFGIMNPQSSEAQRVAAAHAATHAAGR